MPATLRKTSRKAEASRAASSLRRTETIRIGFVPLIDAVPLFVAEELGLFEKAGLRIRLAQELGWGSIREKIIYGQLDAAHAPGGLLFSILCGTHARPRPVGTDTILNLQGNAITLSKRLWQKGVRDGRTLKQMIRSQAPRKPLFAVVSSFSTHCYLLRKWLRLSGIDPDREVRILVLPPPLMGEHMREEQIDGFCSGEPWNSEASLRGDGWIAATSAMLEPLHPEKILLAGDSLLSERSDEYAALRGAILEACRYCDRPENRPKVVDLLHDRGLFPVDREVIAHSLLGSFKVAGEQAASASPFIIFSNKDANRASRERAAWFLNTVVETGSFHPEAVQRRACIEAFRDTPTEG